MQGPVASGTSQLHIGRSRYIDIYRDIYILYAHVNGVANKQTIGAIGERFVTLTTGLEGQEWKSLFRSCTEIGQVASLIYMVHYDFAVTMEIYGTNNHHVYDTQRSEFVTTKGFALFSLPQFLHLKQLGDLS